MVFQNWLAQLLGQDESQVKKLLSDKAALHFLISWSLYESKCFNGFVKIEGLEEFSARIIAENFDTSSIVDAANHFHERYQAPQRLKNLMHGQKCLWIQEILNKARYELTPTDVVRLATLVSYRFRNNIFHGNKGIGSWLQFNQQIQYCSDVLQCFVLHAETKNPSMASVAA